MDKTASALSSGSARSSSPADNYFSKEKKMEVETPLHKVLKKTKCDRKEKNKP